MKINKDFMQKGMFPQTNSKSKSNCIAPIKFEYIYQRHTFIIFSFASVVLSLSKRNGSKYLWNTLVASKALL